MKSFGEYATKPRYSHEGRSRGMGTRGGFSSRGGRSGASYGPPQTIIEVGRVLHTCEEEIVCECALNEQVPYFNGRIFLQNKQEIGKIDEILGPIHKCMFSVKMGSNLKASSFKKDTSLFIDSNQVLPLSRFLPKAPGENPIKTKGTQPAKPKRQGVGSFGRGGFSRGRGLGRAGHGAFRGRSSFRGSH